MDISSSAELKAFDATARTGSMSAAARLLGIRQPTVSAHIAGLEKRFGVELFVRRPRGRPHWAQCSVLEMAFNTARSGMSAIESVKTDACVDIEMCQTST